MTEGKVFGFEKPTRFIHSIAFKVDDEGKEKLESCFELLDVRGKRTSDMMRTFIKKVHKLIGEHEELRKELYKENARLKKKVAKLTKQNEGMMQALSKIGEQGPPAKKPTISKSTKTEARPPTKPLIVKDKSKEVKKPKAAGYSSFATLKEKPGDYITCTKTKQAYKLEDLPCVVDVNLICHNEVCKKQIMKLIA